MFEISELENGREGVRVTGEVDIYTATQFKEPIEKLIEANTKDIFLDLTDLSYIDSTGIGILIELRKGSMSRDLNLSLIHILSAMWEPGCSTMLWGLKMWISPAWMKTPSS